MPRNGSIVCIQDRTDHSPGCASVDEDWLSRSAGKVSLCMLLFPRSIRPSVNNDLKCGAFVDLDVLVWVGYFVTFE